MILAQIDAEKHTEKQHREQVEQKQMNSGVEMESCNGIQNHNDSTS